MNVFPKRGETIQGRKQLDERKLFKKIRYIYTNYLFPIYTRGSVFYYKVFYLLEEFCLDSDITWNGLFQAFADQIGAPVDCYSLYAHTDEERDWDYRYSQT